MSYVTLEVEIDHGKVTTKDPAKLPEKASGLLTILQPERSGTQNFTPLQALEELQNYLHLDENKAADWAANMREARR